MSMIWKYLLIWTWICLHLSSLVMGQDDESLLKEKWCNPDDCYQLLNVEPTAAYREIKTKYNNISLRLHPDKNPNQTEADRTLYVKVVNAWGILGNAQKRRDYDAYLMMRAKYDHPRESIFVVLFILYLAASCFVWLYQKQRFRALRVSILNDGDVQRYFMEHHQMDVSDPNADKRLPKKRVKKEKKIKGRRSKKDKSATSIRRRGGMTRDEGQGDGSSEGNASKLLKESTSMFSEVDPTWNDPRDKVTDEQIGACIKEMGLKVPEWDEEDPRPRFVDALKVIPMWTKDMTIIGVDKLTRMFKRRRGRERERESEGRSKRE